MRRLGFLAAFFTLLFFPTTTQAITFADGTVHVIDSANSFPAEDVDVFDGPGSTTTTVGRLGTCFSRSKKNRVGPRTPRVAIAASLSFFDAEKQARRGGETEDSEYGSVGGGRCWSSSRPARRGSPALASR